jgi:hypothetical protein
MRHQPRRLLFLHLLAAPKSDVAMPKDEFDRFLAHKEVTLEQVQERLEAA